MLCMSYSLCADYNDLYLLHFIILQNVKTIRTLLEISEVSKKMNGTFHPAQVMLTSILWQIL